MWGCASWGFGGRLAPTTGADAWEAFVELRNDGQKAREITLLLQFAGTAAGSKTMTLAAGSETQATFAFQAKKAGLLEARVTSTNGRGDAFPQDDTAVIEVPIGKPLRVAVYSPEPDLLKPLLAGNPQVEATFDLPAKFDAQAAADIVVFDRFVPKDAPKNAASIWIEPPAGSPFAIRSTAANVKLQQWHQETALGAGLYTKDVELGFDRGLQSGAGGSGGGGYGAGSGGGGAAGGCEDGGAGVRSGALGDEI